MQQLAHALPPAEPTPAMFRLDCSARAGELAPIVLVNALLTVLTLGIYRFWAKIRVRRYLWSRTSLLGDAFEYTGTGGELFRGFLIVLFVVLLPLFAYNWAVQLLIPAERFGLQLAALVPWYATVLFLIGVATHRARRYRFSRTSWRGVRGAQQGSAARYGTKFLGSMLLNAVTLGWSYPWTSTRLTATLTNDVWFGDRRFAFAGSAKPLYKRFAAVWLIALLGSAAILGGTVMAGVAAAGLLKAEGLSIWHWSLVIVLLAIVVTGPLLMAWYRARESAYFAACTRYEGLEARYDVTAGALIWLTFSNLLLLIVTLGLGGAFVGLRNLRFACDRLSFHGEIDVATIAQSHAPRPSRGEGLASAFDVDAM